jgi:hypothetical protein
LPQIGGQIKSEDGNKYNGGLICWQPKFGSACHHSWLPEKFVALKSRIFFSLFVILFSDFRSERKGAPKMAGLKPELLQAVAIHLVLCCFLWSSKAEEENSKDHENIRM